MVPISGLSPVDLARWILGLRRALHPLEADGAWGNPNTASNFASGQTPIHLRPISRFGAIRQMNDTHAASADAKDANDTVGFALNHELLDLGHGIRFARRLQADFQVVMADDAPVGVF